jgi:hypothetical protein
MAHMIFAVAVAVGYLTFRLPASAAEAAAWCAVIKDGDYWCERCKWPFCY